MGIKELREKTGLSQSQFARYYDIPVKSLQKWEQGARVPPPYVEKLLMYAIRLRMMNDNPNEPVYFSYEDLKAEEQDKQEDERQGE